tara:strand:+ start:572 stop:1444 length:873 start_codon:yes stop_codon:yes gene_type:complete
MKNVENIIINKIVSQIPYDDKIKSSHWKFHLKNKELFNIYSKNEFGSFTTKLFYKSIILYLLQIIIYGYKITKSEIFKKYYEIYNKINRQIDSDTLRHIFTFKLLKKYDNFKKICIIGDGKANFLLGSLIFYPSAQIFSVNLSEVLLDDYLILKKHKIIGDDKIHVVEDVNDNLYHSSKIIFVPSHLKNFLFEKKIDLFININSFQEMTNSEVSKYFDIIKTNKTLLYTSNRQYKKLYDGEELVFDNYNWGDGVKILYEECPWTKYFYSTKPPFIHKYDGKVKHALVRYN